MSAAPDDDRAAQLVQLTRQQDQSRQQREKCQHHWQWQTQEYASFHDSSLLLIAQRHAGARGYCAIAMLERNCATSK
jgi:hypothetical protein